jgi:hypothetical protein
MPSNHFGHLSANTVPARRFFCDTHRNNDPVGSGSRDVRPYQPNGKHNKKVSEPRASAFLSDDDAQAQSFLISSACVKGTRVSGSVSLFWVDNV